MRFYRTKWAAALTSALLALYLLSALRGQATAQEATPIPTPKPFILPVAGPPGPDAWYFGQTYGNTVGAFFQRDTTYRAGQGLHFGLDFAMPCGTPVVAIGDGTVAKVDAPEHGSRPHNLLLLLDAGYVALYGHLFERPALQVGQRVVQGDVVGLSGDSFATCHSAPHLHLEIRSTNYAIAYNPIDVIEADWDSLALIGAFSRGFERDLDNPRQWQQLDDQPDTAFGGLLLNNFTNPWPPDWFRR
ncbi:MAG TPA: M23 family metallopeptidase [Anaerolineae bacterium]|nr:M23 family metallopeptidase [Anaerolineae bacterium]